MLRTKVTVTDRDLGYKKLVSQLGEMGHVTLGVQGDEAEQIHPTAGIPIGQLAAAHELGLVPGAPARSWLRSWIDSNEARLGAETKAALQEVMAGRKTRNKALQELGYKWTAELRDNIWKGNIKPALSAITIARKGGETRPLLDTYTLMNTITYRLFLPQIRSIRDKAQRMILRKQK